MVTYKRLWKLLIDKGMTKKELAQKAGLNTYTLTKLNKSGSVQSDTLVKICIALGCTFDDIMEIVIDEGER